MSSLRNPTGVTYIFSNHEAGTEDEYDSLSDAIQAADELWDENIDYMRDPTVLYGSIGIKLIEQMVEIQSVDKSADDYEAGDPDYVYSGAITQCALLTNIKHAITHLQQDARDLEAKLNPPTTVLLQAVDSNGKPLIIEMSDKRD